MEIIPAIDIIEGKCVRLTQGDFNQKTVYNENPLEVARQFEDAGLHRLHLVDLDGAREGKVKNWKVLERLAGKTSLSIDFGGGIKKDDDLDVVFNSGAAMATIGSIAVKNEELVSSWISRWHANRFLLGADVREEKITIKGWTENTELSVFDFIRSWQTKGLTKVFCTDVAKDGLLAGPSEELYKKILEEFPQLFFIASGGVRSLADIETLAQIGCKGVIIGKAIYEGRIRLSDLNQFI